MSALAGWPFVRCTADTVGTGPETVSGAIVASAVQTFVVAVPEPVAVLSAVGCTHFVCMALSFVSTGTEWGSDLGWRPTWVAAVVAAVPMARFADIRCPHFERSIGPVGRVAPVPSATAAECWAAPDYFDWRWPDGS